MASLHCGTVASLHDGAVDSLRDGAVDLLHAGVMGTLHDRTQYVLHSEALDELHDGDFVRAPLWDSDTVCHGALNISIQEQRHIPQCSTRHGTIYTHQKGSFHGQTESNENQQNENILVCLLMLISLYIFPICRM